MGKSNKQWKAASRAARPQQSGNPAQQRKMKAKKSRRLEKVKQFLRSLGIAI